MFVGQYILFAGLIIAIILLLGHKAEVLVLCCFCVWSCSESIKGLLQVFGNHISGNAFFKMTGSFFNPGPYGGFIAITISVALGYIICHRKTIDTLFAFNFGLLRRSFSSKSRVIWLFCRVIPLLICIITVFLGIAVLPASGSRAAWLSMAVAMILCIIKETRLLKKLKGCRYKHIIIVCGFLVSILLCAGIFLMKKESAVGRIHIWKMELRAIAANPITGSGRGTALGAYGLAQESYYNQTQRSQADISAASSPEFAFNEYLKVGMEYGILPLLLSVVIVLVTILFLMRRHSAFAYGMIAIGAFALFSYPLSLPQTSLCVALFLSVAAAELLLIGLKNATKGRKVALSVSLFVPIIIVSLLLMPDYLRKRDALNEWKSARMWVIAEQYESAAEKLVTLYDVLKRNYRYMYDYGYALHKVGEYERSIEILEEGAKFSCDPAFRNVIGKNYESLGRYDEAENAFKRSHYLVPARLYPLISLMEMYDHQGKVEEAKRVAAEIVAMPVNKKNLTMLELQSRAKSYL